MEAVNYGLRWNQRPERFLKNFLLCVVLSIFSIFLSWFASWSLPGGFLGNNALYFAVIYYVAITIFFGGWGIIATFIGTFVGIGIIAGIPLGFSLLFGVANVWEAFIPFLFLRTLGKSIGMEPLGTNVYMHNKFHYLILFFVFGALLPSFIGGLWGVFILVLAGVVPSRFFWHDFLGWFVGDAVLIAVFVPPVCNYFGGLLERKGWTVQGIWS